MPGVLNFSLKGYPKMTISESLLPEWMMAPRSLVVGGRS
jgi:hypothetical protein